MEWYTCRSQKPRAFGREGSSPSPATMRAIPKKLKEEMARDPFYKRCCISGATNEKIEFHHNLIYAGRQVNEKWCILPLAKSIHDRIVEFKEKCDWIMLNRATDDDLRRYSKAIDYLKERERLNKKYGIYPH